MVLKHELALLMVSGERVAFQTCHGFSLLSEGEILATTPVDLHPFNLLWRKREHYLKVISDLSYRQTSDGPRIENEWRKWVPYLGTGSQQKDQETADN
jgi:hypothetical protein